MNTDKLHKAASYTMDALGMKPDPWQMDVLTCGHKRLLLNCCRQAGKSTTVAILSVIESVGHDDMRVLLLAPSFRQSKLLFKTTAQILKRVSQHCIMHETTQELDLVNGSQIICLPCEEGTIRGYANVGLLVIDEAARVPDELYRAVSPMLAVSHGRMVCLSTPFGRRGFFWQAWAKGDSDWKRVEVPVDQVPRISKEYLEQARREHGESWCQQEFYCSFEAQEGLVYPDLARCVVQADAPLAGRWYGGIDFGLRNPFAAVWGVIDRDDVLWLVGEHYMRDKSLRFHAARLPKNVTWYADPSGATEIGELRCAGFTMRKANNQRRSGILAVRARIETDRLKILEGACPNLLAEAQLYSYDADSGDEPSKGNDHALDALRYLVSKLDCKKIALFRRKEPPEPEIPPAPIAANHPLVQPTSPSKPRKWLSVYNEALWTRMY
jgi:hypothetical protein